MSNSPKPRFWLLALNRWKICLIGLMSVSSLFGQSKSAAKTPIPKPTDYIVEHLRRAKSMPLSPEQQQLGVSGYVSSVKEVTIVDTCVLSLRYETLLINLNVPATLRRNEEFSLNFKDAELNSPHDSGSTVTVRMIVPVNVTVKDVSVSPLTFGKEEPGQHAEERFKITLPAEDDEDAARLSRALNQQIRACGGKPDPFAK